jgi:hypothetical protein
MLASLGKGGIMMRVCFGYFASPDGNGQGSNPVLQIIWSSSATSSPVPGRRESAMLLAYELVMSPGPPDVQVRLIDPDPAVGRCLDFSW